jgi:hypothetical protein
VSYKLTIAGVGRYLDTNKPPPLYFSPYAAKVNSRLSASLFVTALTKQNKNSDKNKKRKRMVSTTPFVTRP